MTEFARNNNHDPSQIPLQELAAGKQFTCGEPLVASHDSELAGLPKGVALLAEIGLPRQAGGPGSEEVQRLYVLDYERPLWVLPQTDQEVAQGVPEQKARFAIFNPETGGFSPLRPFAETVVGRRSEAGAALNVDSNNLVSAGHIRIIEANNTVTIEDNHSTNGTWIAGNEALDESVSYDKARRSREGSRTPEIIEGVPDAVKYSLGSRLVAPVIEKPATDPRWFQPGTKGNPDRIQPPKVSGGEVSATESDEYKYDQWLQDDAPGSVESAAVRPDSNSPEELTKRRREADAAHAAMQRIGRPEMN